MAAHTLLTFRKQGNTNGLDEIYSKTRRWQVSVNRLYYVTDALEGKVEGKREWSKLWRQVEVFAALTYAAEAMEGR